MAVLRVEPRDSALPPVEAAIAEAAIAEAAAVPGVRALQVDFDATLSERPFYRSLLAWGGWSSSLGELHSWRSSLRPRC